MPLPHESGRWDAVVLSSVELCQDFRARVWVCVAEVEEEEMVGIGAPPFQTSCQCSAVELVVSEHWLGFSGQFSIFM